MTYKPENKELLIQQVLQTRLGGKVQRAHAIPHQGSYSVAEHSWGATMILLLLWPGDFERLGPLMLTHDLAECVLGDIPAPVLKHCSSIRHGVIALHNQFNKTLGLPPLTSVNPIEGDAEKIRACDYLDFYFWVREQHILGNDYVREADIELQNYISGHPLIEPAQWLYEYFQGRNSGPVYNSPRSFLPLQAGVIREMQEALDNETSE